MKLALTITPQRSAQYSNMTAALAAPELLASPLGAAIRHVEPVMLAGQAHLLVDIDDTAVPDMLPILSRLGVTSAAYEYFAHIGEIGGPLLRAVEARLTPFVSLEMAETRRYKGKTNEIFTHVLLNIAIFAGAYSGQFTERLRVLDPLAGGGTTLFLALAAGYDAFGIEHARQDVETTAVFVKQYLNSERIPYKELDERRRAGRRYQFEVGRKGATRLLVLAHGIQHFGEIAELLREALPAWESLLLPGGTLALAWNATRVERSALVELVERQTHLKVRNDPPYTQFAHAVDRVIKKRDILVAVKQSTR